MRQDSERFRDRQELHLAGGMKDPSGVRLSSWLPALVALILAAAFPAQAQEERPLIDVEFYEIHADLDFADQLLDAEAKIRFIPREETQEVVFELHNALNVTSVVDSKDFEIPAVRFRQDYTVRLRFNEVLPVDDPVTITMSYDGRLEDDIDSPYEGIELASIDQDHALLLYPGRWFPVNGYSADRFTAHVTLEVPADMKVVGSGLSYEIPGGDEDLGTSRYRFEFDQPSFPGSFAVVRSEPIRVVGEGGTTQVYFRSGSRDLAQAYGEAVEPIVDYFSEKFGAPYSRSIAVIEAGDRSPAGYAAPGLVFLSPWAIGDDVNHKLLATQIAHQWWRVITSPGNRRHTWLDWGLARYSALLQIEDAEGEAVGLEELDDTRIHALTYDEIPLLQANRLPDFSTEVDALAGSKGAMVLRMLRWVVGEETFFNILRQFLDRYAWQSMTTGYFQEVAEEVSGRSLGPFFIQWTENRGTPEFTQEYSIYRLGDGKGFRVIGKVKQDLDTFGMPVEVKIETEGEPEFKVVDVQGTSSDFVLETFGKPKKVVLDPNNRILRYDESIRTRVAIRKGEQLFGLGYYREALTEYQRALELDRYSSLAHYRVGEVFFAQNNYQSAANEFREALNGDQVPQWTEVWAHINLGQIFDITGQRERAVNEYQLAIRTRDNTVGAQEIAQRYLETPYQRPRRKERIY